MTACDPTVENVQLSTQSPRSLIGDMHYISYLCVASRPFLLPRRTYLTMSTELEKSRLAVADEVKFDMLAAISDLGDHPKQYKTISRNLVCKYSGLLIAAPYLKHGA